MSAADQTVHAVLSDGRKIIRYDRAGKWHIVSDEDESPRRTVIALEDAVSIILNDEGAVWYEGLSGGLQLDARIRRRRRGNG